MAARTTSLQCHGSILLCNGNGFKIQAQRNIRTKVKHSRMKALLFSTSLDEKSQTTKGSKSDNSREEDGNCGGDRKNPQRLQWESSKIFSPIVDRRIRDLENHPAVSWNASSTFASVHKKKLGRRHISLFERSNTTSISNYEGDTNFVGRNETLDYINNNDVEYDSLFDEFAKVVCVTGAVAKKEVFESWASALYIYSSFLAPSHNDSCNEVLRENSIRRVADIAGGHGLLAWALLLLDDEKLSQIQTSKGKYATKEIVPLTAFYLDVKMPRSAEAIQSAVIERWPHLEKRFDYVEGRLEQLVPHTSCLLASVHACGSLSDVLVATAAAENVPLAVVPCCHSRKKKVLKSVASPYARNEYEEILNEKGSMPNLAERLDDARMTALENAGFVVNVAFIPTIFTGKNRLIMGFPSSTAHPMLNRAKVSVTIGRMPPLNNLPVVNPKPQFLKGFYVPCEDSNLSRERVSEIAGRAAANKRKFLSHNRGHVEVPRFDLSLWLPSGRKAQLEGDACHTEFSEESICCLVKNNFPNIECIVTKLGPIYVCPETGRSAQTFRIQYSSSDVISVGEKCKEKFVGSSVSGEDTKVLLSFDAAKDIHKRLYEMIPVTFPGAECR